MDMIGLVIFQIGAVCCTMAISFGGVQFAFDSPVTVNSYTPESNIYGYTCLVGIGVGCFLTAGITVAQTKVPASDMTSVVGFMTVEGLDANIQPAVIEQVTAAISNTFGLLIAGSALGFIDSLFLGVKDARPVQKT
ncbi:hypothetical protein DL766_000242 [Monosporascus sp. MC13-8B]|uniref:Uncharacterized protein n=1 Tax=Monosporascus cannonballus TaxID=155416 RepID=A0ABY0H4N2_9PEZI|nr:hypothetical protein DL762_005506 [Monosporascus cannonballus]RYO93090.1 hypothetical protein DL763_004486 [Monosporascus cannonballus]RYP39800.1 hypothetical protein DL766_000242 [Monosporascus sp. MC13-8B]